MKREILLGAALAEAKETLYRQTVLIEVLEERLKEHGLLDPLAIAAEVGRRLWHDGFPPDLSHQPMSSR
ncbi:MAG: hypothetical protein KM310_05590 [Clostridiales bacterium]|nr:hypothetical protein [Clostridiales bacterium]